MGFMWCDSFLMLHGALHLTQPPQPFRAVSGDLTNSVKRAWCLRSTPIPGYPRRLSCRRVCQVRSGVVWAILLHAGAFWGGSWRPSRNLRKSVYVNVWAEVLVCTYLTNWRGLVFLHIYYYLLPETGEGTWWIFDLDITISIFLLKWQWNLRDFWQWTLF